MNALLLMLVLGGGFSTPPGGGGPKTDDTVLVGTGTGSAEKSVPQCTSGQKIQYTLATNVFSCATDNTGAGSAWTDYEIDFGLTADLAQTATVTDASSTATSKIVIIQSGLAATGRQADENEMDSLHCRAIPAVGTFKLICTSLEGATHGLHKISYQIN